MNIFKGEHELIQLFDDYYLATLMENKTYVTFCWKMPDGQLQISTILMEYFRINFVDTFDITPTITFRWTNSHNPRVQDLIEQNIVYIILTCKKEQWKFYDPSNKEE